ncbi:MAG: hypothetical protein RR565_06455 [Erysipelothrix sp.]
MTKQRWFAFFIYMLILLILLSVELIFKINISKYIYIGVAILIAIQFFTSVSLPDGGFLPYQEAESRAKDTKPFFPMFDFWLWTIGFAFYALILIILK